MAMMGRVMQQVENPQVALHDVLANDDHLVVLHETSGARNSRTLHSQYVDVYHVRGGKATEHWHLAVDPKVEEAFFAG